MPPTASSSPDGGYTLVEMLVAIVLLGLVMSAMATGSVSAFTSVRSSNGQVAANQFANEVIERLRADAFDAVSPPGALVSHSPVIAAKTVKGTTYTPTATVTWLNDTCNDTAALTSRYDYLQLRVQVAWTVNQQAKSITVESFRVPGNLYRSPAAAAQTTTRAATC